jgi:hypothetical protein
VPGGGDGGDTPPSHVLTAEAVCLWVRASVRAWGVEVVIVVVVVVVVVRRRSSS